jgi:hypothetical protein
LCEEFGTDASDTASATRDDGHFSIESNAHAVSPFGSRIPLQQLEVYWLKIKI